MLVFPDELQVNDALYAELLATRVALDDYQRDLPQQRIRAFCRSEGLACVDLLEPLRRAEAFRRTYYARDTHLNAHGNAVAGRELADALLRLERSEVVEPPEDGVLGPVGQ